MSATSTSADRRVVDRGCRVNGFDGPQAVEEILKRRRRRRRQARIMDVLRGGGGAHFHDTAAPPGMHGESCPDCPASGRRPTREGRSVLPSDAGEADLGGRSGLRRMGRPCRRNPSTEARAFFGMGLLRPRKPKDNRQTAPPSRTARPTPPSGSTRRAARTETSNASPPGRGIEHCEWHRHVELL